MIRPGDPFNAFLDYGQAPVSNAQSGPLAGLTLAVKDIFDVAGYRSGWGNPVRLAEAPVATVSNSAVQAMLDSGARFVGKTQTEELAFSMIGQNVHFPRPINPRAPGRVTGGSSSGSAAAVAGGLADIATGSDTGGSIRAPASFCGLIGLRTTHGAIPLDHTMPLAAELRHVRLVCEGYGDVSQGGGCGAGSLPVKREGPLPPALRANPRRACCARLLQRNSVVCESMLPVSWASRP